MSMVLLLPTRRENENAHAHLFGVRICAALIALHTGEGRRHIHAELHFTPHGLLLMLLELVGHLDSSVCRNG